MESALFDAPAGITIDASGAIYVADFGNSEIRTISTGLVVSTLAGSPATAGGCQDGPGAAAGFYGPGGIAVDASGTLYVADSFNNLIRRVSASGTVSTLGGVYQVNNEVDGVGMTAQLDTPFGIACDATGNLIVADSFNNVIRSGVPYAAPSGGGGTPGPTIVTVTAP